MMRSLVGVTLIALVSVVFAGGCVSFGRSDAASFYVLSSLAPTAARSDPGAPDVVIGLRPIRIPDYLDRPGIVTRTGENRVSVATFSRWAQPLDEDISRVLAEDLAALRPAARVVEFPWRASAKVDYQVEVVVDRFESIASGDVLLVTRWVVMGADGTPTLDSSASTITIAPQAESQGTDYASIVAAMSEALKALSREIAAAIPESPQQATNE